MLHLGLVVVPVCVLGLDHPLDLVAYPANPPRFLLGEPLRLPQLLREALLIPPHPYLPLRHHLLVLEQLLELPLNGKNLLLQELNLILPGLYLLPHLPRPIPQHLLLLV